MCFHHQSAAPSWIARKGRWRSTTNICKATFPIHLALNPVAPTMDERLRIRRTYDPLVKLKKNQFMATTIFPPDQRRVFSDTSFPWCTVGRVDVTGGWDRARSSALVIFSVPRT